MKKKTFERELPPDTEEAEDNLAFFSKLYRLLRNEGGNLPIVRMIYARLPACCRTGFIHSLNDEKKAAITEAIQELQDIIDQRRSALYTYWKKLEGMRLGTLYPYMDGAVPWRLNLLVEDCDLRRKVIDECLERHLPVSDWYPSITPMFGIYDGYPGAMWHEQHILNFPLVVEDMVKWEICEVLLKHLGR